MLEEENVLVEEESIEEKVDDASEEVIEETEK